MLSLYVFNGLSVLVGILMTITVSVLETLHSDLDIVTAESVTINFIAASTVSILRTVTVSTLEAIV